MLHVMKASAFQWSSVQMTTNEKTLERKASDCSRLWHFWALPLPNLRDAPVDDAMRYLEICHALCLLELKHGSVD